MPLVTSPLFLTVCGLSLGLTLLRETFNTWSVHVLCRVARAIERATAAGGSALFPLLGGASVLVAGWLGDWLVRRARP